MSAADRLPADWQPVSQALDLFPLADILTRPPDGAMFARALGVLRRRMAQIPGDVRS